MKLPCDMWPVLLLLAGVAAAPGYPAATQPAVTPIIEPEALATDLRDPGWVDRGIILVDVRPAKRFTAGHVRNARSLDLADWARRAKSEEDLGQGELWRRRIAAMGFTADDPVVIYDEDSMTEAARLWFILQHFGVRRAGIVNGGFAALRPLLPAEWIVGGDASDPAPAGSAQIPGGSTGQVGLIDKGGLRQHLGGSELVVLDVRTEGEYLGTDARGNPRTGHLPGAINLPHQRLIDERGRLKSPDALKAVFAEAGLKPGQQIVMHCQSGGRSSLAALAAVVAGYQRVDNYYLSFADWAADESCPLQRPASGD